MSRPQLLAIALGTSCEGDTTGPRDMGSAVDMDAADVGRVDASGGDASWPGPDEVAEGEAYEAGVYRCCAEGDGTNCCSTREQGTCFRYGGVIGDCVGEGGTMEAKDICSHCCAGLERLAPMELQADACVETAPPSVFVCVACGDGQCGDGENSCVCPQDCTNG